MSNPLEGRYCSPGSQRIWVERARTNKDLRCIFLGPWRGMYCHYDQDRKKSYPCVGATCKAHIELVWYAFAPALTYPTERDPGVRYIVAELTDHSAGKLTGMTLRGRVARLFKARKDNLMITDVELMNGHAKENTLPTPFDVVPILKKLYPGYELPLDTVRPPFPTGPNLSSIEIVSYPPSPEEQENRKAVEKVINNAAKGMGRII